jgi:hypothetical protein
MSKLIRTSLFKAYTLEVVKANRAGKFTRVSKEFLDRAERGLRTWIQEAVHRHPSVGKTLK